MGYTDAAIVLDGLSLIAIALLEIYTGDNVYKALVLIPLFRLLSTSLPVFMDQVIYSYIILYILMLIPMYIFVSSGEFSLEELGISIRGIVYSIPLGAILGLALGFVEYHILNLELVPGLAMADSFKPLLIIFLLGGLVEEFVFRSAVQTVLERKLGLKAGLLVASILFGFTYSIYGAQLVLLFGLSSGLALGFLFQKIRSLLIVVLAHVIANITLFIVLPGLQFNLIQV